MGRLNLPLAVAISICLHILGAAWFHFQPQNSSFGIKGKVSVELIEAAPANHPPAPKSSHHRHAKRLVSPSPTATPEMATAAPEPTATATAPTSPGAAAGSVGKGPSTQQFVLEVARLIEQKKIYPRSALRREEEGRVLVALTIGRTGDLIHVEIEQACHFSSLNEAAIATVESIQKFPEVPMDLAAPIHVHVPLVFTIDR